MKTTSTIVLSAAAAAIASSADAGFLGFAGFTRVVGSNRIIDVFAVVANQSDRLMNVYDANITNTNGNAFVQQAGLSTRGWGRDAATSNRANGVDSFMTIGVDGGGPYYGIYTASAASPDGSFTNWSGSGSPNSATGIPANAGWFLSPPTDPANVAESLNSADVLALGTRYNIGNAASGNYGVWCAHLVLANPNNVLCYWTASAYVKDGPTQTSSSGTATGLIPAPGAVAVLAVAGLASRRRRA